MNKDVFKGKWHQFKGEVKSQWGKLTDDDMERVEGDAEKLIGRVQERYGYQRAEAEREVNEFLDRHPEGCACLEGRALMRLPVIAE
jgi:uncharacterized protein YjbJ (UPF0337 family)